MENIEMTTMLGPPHPVAMPTVTKTDKLRLAAAKGQLDVVQELLESGTVLHPDKDGRTPLHFAAQNGHLEVCRVLIKHGCHPDDQDHIRYTALHRAASQGHAEVIEYLLEQHCDINIQDENGNAALHEASWHGFSRTLDVLIKYNCNIVVTNKAGFTALHLAAQNGHNQSTRILLLAGCNADLKNNYGDTALHTAARYGHAGVTRILISARCSLNEQNKNGDTALHIAAALKRRKIAKLLVDAGIEINIKNKQAETAIEVASRKEHPEIIVIISSFTRPKTPKTVNFKEFPVEMEGPIVVPDEETPVKAEKQEKKFFDFFKKKKKDKEKDKSGNQTPADKSAHQSVQGFFSQYVPKPGVQYYRDLAGNIKQGPIGYTPICQCMPTLQKLEHQVHTNQEEIYDHIDASNRAINNRLDQLDQRTTQQVREIDQATRRMLANEESHCRDRIRKELEGEREYMQQRYQDNIKMDVQDWLEAKLGSYGHCLDHHHDDTALPNNNIFSEIHENENGRLFRSRSDETLSQSDNHSGKFRKKAFYESRQAAMQQIRAWQTPAYKRETTYRVRGSSQAGPKNVSFSNNPSHNQYRTKAEIHPQYQPSNSVPISHNDRSHEGNQYHSQQQNEMPSRRYDSRPPSRNYSQNPMSHVSPSLPNTGDPVYGSFQNVRSSDAPMQHSYNQIHSASGAMTQHSQIHRSGGPLMSHSPGPEQLRRGQSSPQVSKDPIYNSPQQSHGAIPKRIPHSQTWHDGQFSNAQRRESSPLTHMASNVYHSNDQRHLPKSRTELNGFHHNKTSLDDEFFKRDSQPRQSMPDKPNSNQGFNRNLETRQSFPERGPSDTNKGGTLSSSNSSGGAGQGPQDCSRPSSGRSDRPFVPPKPTFTTFGYDNSKPKERPLPTNSAQNSVSYNTPRLSTPRSTMAGENENPYSSLPSRSQTPHNEDLPKATEQTYSTFAAVRSDIKKPSEITNSNLEKKDSHKDDMYISMSQKSTLRQRTRSSDGLLLDDDVTSAHDMVKKNGPLDSSTPLLAPSRIPSVGYQRDGCRYMPQNGQINSNSLGQSSRQYPASSGNHFSNMSRNSPATKSSNGNHYSQSRNTPTESVYVTMKSIQDSPHTLDTDRKSGPYWGNGNIRENPYASVRDVSHYPSKNNSHINKPLFHHVHSTYHVNSASQNQYPPQPLSKSESNLDKSTNDIDHDAGYTMPRSTGFCVSPSFNNSAETSSPKAVSNYPHAYTKEDNSSNPDSGYCSKIFGNRTTNGNAPSNSGTPSSSFSTDHDHSLSVSSHNNSPHPQANHSDYEQIQDVSRAINHGQNLQAHVEGWYQKKLKEAAIRLRDKPYNADVQNDQIYTNRTPNYKSPNSYSRQYVPSPHQNYPDYSNQTYNRYRNLSSYVRGSDV